MPVIGALKGHGISAMRSRRYRRYFEEHGYIISVVSVRPKSMYHQGIPRHLLRTVKEDFWQRELQTIGQQEIYNREVYAGHATPGGVFGYQDRYDEYRRNESRVMGEFHGTVLNNWHMARDFSSDPALNSTFVEANPTTRIFAASTNDTLYAMIAHSMQARRLVAKIGKSRTF